MLLSNSATVLKSNRGSAISEFILLAVPLILLALSVSTISFVVFARNVVADSVVEGARFAALADQDSESGCLRTKMLIATTLPSILKLEQKCQSVISAAGIYEVASVVARFPVISALLPAISFRVSAKAPREIQ